MKTLQTICFLCAITLALQAQQNSAGKCFSIDYESWNAGSAKPPIYINCGNNNSLNTGYELTLECWIKIHNCAWNQKIIGKMDNTLSNGYVMGMEVGKNYSEIFNPIKNETKFGNIPLDSAWMHLAVTFAAGNKMIAYVNGDEVGNVTVSANPIASNDRPLIIGNAPWDLSSLQSFGDIDEVRVWSVARSADDIKAYMHKSLVGNESGLVAYYPFNNSTDSLVYDISGNNNNGKVSPNGEDYWNWDESYAAVGSPLIYFMSDVKAVWYGLCQTADCYSAPSGGLSVLSKIAAKQFDYAVFGHNNSSGTTTSDAPANANDFVRLSKIWYFNATSNVKADLMFNLNDASGVVKPLGQSSNPNLYTLLVSNDSAGPFVPLHCANQVISSGLGVKFNNIALANKYYTVSYSSNQLVGPSSINENEWASQISIFPNPGQNTTFIENADNNFIEFYDALGKTILTKNITSKTEEIPIQQISPGLYFIRVYNNKHSIVKRFIKN